MDDTYGDAAQFEGSQATAEVEAEATPNVVKQAPQKGVDEFWEKVDNSFLLSMINPTLIFSVHHQIPWESPQHLTQKRVRQDQSSPFPQRSGQRSTGYQIIR